MEKDMRMIKKNKLVRNILTVLIILQILVVLIGDAGTFRKIITAVVCLGFVVFYNIFVLIKKDSKLFGYLVVVGSLGIPLASVFFDNNTEQLMALFIILAICFVYMSPKMILLSGGIVNLAVLAKIIMLIVGKGDCKYLILFIAMYFIFTFALFRSCQLIEKFQEDDSQEIKYHLDYQTEVTGNIMNVVDEANVHVDNLNNMLNSFKDGTEEVNKALEAISHGVTDTAENIEGQSYMTSQIQDVIDNLITVKDHTVKYAEDAVRTTVDGTQAIVMLKEKSNNLNDINGNVSKVSQQLYDKIVSAQEITEMIYDISSQTNLLALNASIEAARAGEQGKGFAVVADEIRKLADDTRNSIENITALLQGITELADNTSELIKDSVEAVKEQNLLIEGADQSFQTITDVVERLHLNMSEIDKLGTSLNESNNSIIENVSNQQAASEEIAANAQTSAELSETNLKELGNVILELDNVVGIVAQLKKSE